MTAPAPDAADLARAVEIVESAFIGGVPGQADVAGWRRLRDAVLDILAAMRSREQAIAEAVAAENEACARIVEQGVDEGPVFCDQPGCVAAAIRARREKGAGDA